MNDSYETFVIAFYSSLKKKSNCVKENMLILNTCSFQKMLSNLTCVLIYSLTKCVIEYDFRESCVLNILLNPGKYIHGRVYCLKFNLHHPPTVNHAWFLYGMTHWAEMG